MAIVRMKLEDIPPLTREQKIRLRRLARQPDSKIDFSEIPELTDEWFEKARAAAKAAARPKPNKEPVALRLDADVLAWFRSQGKGYQSQINAILRAYTEAHSARTK